MLFRHFQILLVLLAMGALSQPTLASSNDASPCDPVHCSWPYVCRDGGVCTEDADADLPPNAASKNDADPKPSPSKPPTSPGSCSVVFGRVTTPAPSSIAAVVVLLVLGCRKLRFRTAHR